MDTGYGDMVAVQFTSSRKVGSPVLLDLLDQIPPDQEIGTVTRMAPSTRRLLKQRHGRAKVI